MPLLLAEENVENFWPLSLTRATFELRYGTRSPIERALEHTTDIVLRAREELAPYLRAKYGLPVNEDREGEVFGGLPLATPWEILGQSSAHIASDFEPYCRKRVNFLDSGMATGAHIAGNRADVFLGVGAVVGPGCVIDASDGPVMVGAGSSLKFSYVQGPAFIGPNCQLLGARIRAGTSLGPHCRVGGEVSASIFQSRVNKAHDGFVGNSWAGRWVNFGAVATTSNLKNTYGEIRYQRDSETIIATGTQFLGAIVGDHSKIGIMQGLSTGSNIGVGCNIYGGGIAPKYVPSFSWGGSGGWQEYRLEDFLKTVRSTLGRRESTLRDESEAVLRRVYEDSASVRMAFVRRMV